jgi:hypothetical protein
LHLHVLLLLLLRIDPMALHLVAAQPSQAMPSCSHHAALHLLPSQLHASLSRAWQL